MKNITVKAITEIFASLEAKYTALEAENAKLTERLALAQKEAVRAITTQKDVEAKWNANMVLIELSKLNCTVISTGTYVRAEFEALDTGAFSLIDSLCEKYGASLHLNAQGSRVVVYMCPLYPL